MNDAGKKIEVLDKGFVYLQDMMPHWSLGVSAEQAVVNAARVSFLNASKGYDADARLLRYMLKHKHTSPFEHVMFKFHVKAPLIVWWQWVRHRTWSYNFQSGRYVEFKEDDFYIPEEWRRQSKSNKQGSDGLVEINDVDFEWELSALANLSYRQYTDAIEHGVAREQARVFLPGFAVYYEAICTVDAHNLIHFLRLRLDAHAQYEIRQYASAIWQNAFKNVMPVTSAYLSETEPETFK